MNLLYSVQPSVLGKTNQHLLGSGWSPVQADRRAFVQTNFIDGVAITAAHYETDRRHDAGWLHANLLIVDIDEYPDDGTDWTLERVWSDPFVQEYCFAAFPSSSYDESKPKLHLYFQADALIEDKEQYRAISEYLRGMIAIPSDPALSKPSQAVYGTVFTKIRAEKTFTSPLLYFNPDAPCIKTEGIEVDYAAMWDGADILPKYSTIRSKHTSARAVEHMTQPPHLQERVVLEALEWAMRGWGRKSHEDWKALIMSAYAGSPTPDVVRFIMQSDEVEWRPGEREALPAWWNKHEPWKAGGYTVATLFMLARRNGWLTRTSADIDEATEFFAEEVGDFLVEKMPKRALIISNTGTGKTQGAIRMLKKLGTPKSVFFAPTIKLCYNLSTTLTQLGVVNTLYIDKGITKDADTLRQANVLVTTLQTFGTKLVNSGVNIKDYKMVVMDESDDLFTSFVLSGSQVALKASSHVSQEQARPGILALQRIFAEVEHVLMLDGTATQLSVRLSQAFSTEPVKVYRNLFKRTKAPVVMLDTLEEARQRFVESVKDGKKVVLIADKKTEAELMDSVLMVNGYARRNEVVCITSGTGEDANVEDFFNDVEAGADKYRVVIYNSSMGVGVSIVKTKPDVIVQIASYISPRVNLQMLNRYRVQGDVFIYTPHSENLYDETQAEATERLEATGTYDDLLMGIDERQTDLVAKIVADLAILARTDLREQMRARGMYYRHLLEMDGRAVSEGDANKISDADLAAARKAIKEEVEEVMQGWRSVAPIDRENPAEDGMTPIEIAKGRLHALVNRVIPDNEDTGIEDADLAKMAKKFSGTIRSLEGMFDTDALIENARYDLADDVAVTGRRFHMARMDLIGLVGMIFKDTTVVLEQADLDVVAPGFVMEVARRKPIYNTLAGYSNSFDKLFAAHEETSDLAFALTKQILKNVGLKVGKANGKRIGDTEQRERIYRFVNADDALTVLRLRGTDAECVAFDVEKTQELFTHTKDIGPKLAKMSKEARKTILDNGEFIL